MSRGEEMWTAALQSLSIARRQLAAISQEERRLASLVQVMAASDGPSSPHVRATVEAWRGAQLRARAAARLFERRADELAQVHTAWCADGEAVRP